MYALAFGLGMGIGYVFDGAVWPNLFGRKFQGQIRGFVYTASVIGSAIGPAIFGLSYDYAGGYEPALWTGAGLCLVVLLLALAAPAPSGAKRSALNQALLSESSRLRISAPSGGRRKLRL